MCAPVFMFILYITKVKCAPLTYNLGKAGPVSAKGIGSILLRVS
jgi:hypothetical protein